MKCKKIWIAVHPEEPHNVEVSFADMSGEHTTIYAGQYNHNDAYVEWKEYVIIEIEE